MYKLESVQENETLKIFWDFDIQPDHRIPDRRPDLMLINKKKRTFELIGFSIPVDHAVKIKESKKLYKYLDLA